ncbi:hypothetical protein GY45DRAFT_1320921 [Cubamyces sp. BRFM 1775]|nr:hypothetical protein GY45DRAFT_1320921 [Cubamyces sp. BRFM 1775]
MRVCSASAARVLTLFSLALLSSHSFILANAQASSTGTGIITSPDSPGDGTAPSGSSSPSPVSPTQTSTNSPVTSPTSTPTPTSPSPTSKPPASTKSTTPQTSSHTPQTSPSDTNTAGSSTDTQTAAQTGASSDTFSQAPTSTTPTSAPTDTSASTSATSASTTPSATTLPSTTSSIPPATQPSKTLVVGSDSTGQANNGQDTTTYNWLSSTASATGAAAAGDVSASSKGFFSNKGAVAGTFTVVGVVALGAVFVGIIYAKRRAARLQDEEDMTYFEKYNGPNTDNHDGGPGDLSFGNDNPSEAQIMTHAAPDAYPDRSMHYGLPTMEEYTQPQPMNFSYDAAAAGVGYPAGTAYARAQAQQGQYQYDGQTGAYGADYSAQYQEAYYDPRRSPSSPTHPYADPRNSPRAEGAPPVQPYSSNVELVEGEAR